MYSTSRESINKAIISLFKVQGYVAKQECSSNDDDDDDDDDDDSNNNNNNNNNKHYWKTYESDQIKWKVDFLTRGENWGNQRKNSWSRVENQQTSLTNGLWSQPSSHWWKASSLTFATTQLHRVQIQLLNLPQLEFYILEELIWPLQCKRWSQAPKEKNTTWEYSHSWKHFQSAIQCKLDDDNNDNDNDDDEIV